MKNTTFLFSKISCLLVVANLVFAPAALAHNHSAEKHKETTQVSTELTISNLITLPQNTLAGGQPSEADLKQLSAQGIQTVVNFRGDGEFDKYDEAQAVTKNGMNYVHIPIDSREALNKDNVKKFRDALNASPEGTFLHCGSGNRVGALFALDAYWNQNKSAEEALAIGKEAGLTSLTEHVESLLVE